MRMRHSPGVYLFAAALAAMALLGIVPSPASASMVLEVRVAASQAPDVFRIDAKNVRCTTPGSVVHLEIYATVNATNPATSGFLSAEGSLVSDSDVGSSLGDLLQTLVAPFGAASSNAGTATDLDGDGDKDVGATVNSNGTAGLISYRADTLQSGLSFLVGTATFTMNSVLGTTSINFQVATVNGANANPVWKEDGTVMTHSTGTVLAGLPVNIATPEPTSLGLLLLLLPAVLVRRRGTSPLSGQR